MALLQCLAARLAGVDKLVYHTFQKQFSDAYQQAQEILNKTFLSKDKEGESLRVAELVNRIEAMEFRWGESDGN